MNSSCWRSILKSASTFVNLLLPFRPEYVRKCFNILLKQSCHGRESKLLREFRAQERAILFGPLKVAVDLP